MSDSGSAQHVATSAGPAASAAGSRLDGELVRSLQPALEVACRGKLEDIRWFTTDWQRGGATTAYARIHEAFDSIEGWETERDVVIKLPIGWRELKAMTELSLTSAPTPRVCMSGMELDGYDLGWIVMERLDGDPVHTLINGNAREIYDGVCTAAAAFYSEASTLWPLPKETDARYDWAAILQRAQQGLRDNPTIESRPDWIDLVARVVQLMPTLLAKWRGRAIQTWCHGDLHPGNAMKRPSGSPWGDGGYVLIDFADVRAGHWIEDAVYMERLCWARPDVLELIDPVEQLAEARRRKGLAVAEDYRELADIRRVFMAACAPAFLQDEGHPAYLAAALGVLDRVVPRLNTN